MDITKIWLAIFLGFALTLPMFAQPKKPGVAPPNISTNKPTIQQYYALDADWRTLTNQIAFMENQMAKLSASNWELQKRISDRMKAKQSADAEVAQVKAMENNRAGLKQKVAELRIKQLEVELRVEAAQKARKLKAPRA